MLQSLWKMGMGSTPEIVDMISDGPNQKKKEVLIRTRTMEVKSQKPKKRI